jgi:hypothetical protein
MGPGGIPAVTVQADPYRHGRGFEDDDEDENDDDGKGYFVP